MKWDYASVILWLKDNYMDVAIAIFISVEVITGLIVWWEMLTDQSIVDKIWDLMSHLRRK